MPCVASAAAPPGFFGVNALKSSDAEFAAMADADVGVVRAVFPFGAFKQAPSDRFDWTYADGLVANTAANAIDLIPVMYGAPPWISGDLNATPLEGEAAAGWRDLLIAVADRYGPGGRFWRMHPDTPYRPLRTFQIWNEPNSVTWWGPRPAPGEYASLLRRSARAIHSVDPAAKIMTAGIVADPSNDFAIPGPTFLRRLFAARGAADAADAVGYHPYAPTVPQVRDQLRAARAALERSPATEVPIWVTELGWGSKGPREHPLIKSVPGQERTLARVFAMLLEQRERLGIEGALWYLWRERPDTLCRWCRSSGLVHRSTEPKPLLDTFRRIAAR